MPTLTVPGDLASLMMISDMVVEQATLAGFDKHDVYQLQLAVDELATNSIVHGYQEHGLTGNVTVTTELTDDALTLTVEDSAVPFDPTQRNVAAVEETFDDPLHQRPIGGLGIYFVLQAVDKFDYQRINGHNRNTLVVFRTSDVNEPVATGNAEKQQ
jgi:serine/threonine-protein kinase RsbW